MTKQDGFGAVMKLNGCDIPSQEDWNDWILEPMREYPFDSRIITSYMLINTKTNEKLQMLPETLLTRIRDLIDEFY